MKQIPVLNVHKEMVLDGVIPDVETMHYGRERACTLYLGFGAISQ